MILSLLILSAPAQAVQITEMSEQEIRALSRERLEYLCTATASMYKSALRELSTASVERRFWAMEFMERQVAAATMLGNEIQMRYGTPIDEDLAPFPYRSLPEEFFNCWSLTQD